MVLCANKTDLPAEMWEVSREQFTMFAEENKLTLYEASASSGSNVEEVITQSLYLLLLLKYISRRFMAWRRSCLITTAALCLK
jgi:hypothetical protein